MIKNIQRAEDRGGANHGWLHARFSFSFADYHNPNRMGFGKIRVLNDDTISPENGFGTHPHHNMEIISIVTEGELTHKDNTGSEEVIVPGMIQVMSAGSGILHSEYNNSKTDDVRLFQIWIETNKQDVDPRHETKTLDIGRNKLVKVVSGEDGENENNGKEEKKAGDTLFIYQNASIWMGEFDLATEISFETDKKMGSFIMVVEGSAVIEGEVLSKRDSVEVEDVDVVDIKVEKDTKLLLIHTVM